MDQQPTREELLKKIEQQNNSLQNLSTRLETIQNRTRKILTSLPIGLLILNDESKIEAANSRIEGIFNYTPRELAGQNIKFLFPELEKIEIDSAQRRVSAIKKDQERITCEIFFNEIGEDGEKRIFMHLQDVSERQRLEQLRKDFVSMVSHDLRTPLTSINMLLAMVGNDRFGKIDEAGYKAVTRAQSNADYLIKLVSDLLDAEQLESGDLDIDARTTSIQSVLEKVYDSSAAVAQAQNVSLKTEIVDGNFVADEDRVVQVLINLVSNAIKYSSPESAVVLSAQTTESGVLFKVVDHGPGIPANLKEAIFERYKQLSQPKHLKRRGFGLGLAICKALVEAHQGKIWVESEEGQGSTFFVSLPSAP